MELDDTYQSGFIRQVDASRRGETTFIPIALDRVGYSFNLLQSRYLFLFGGTGSGKTSWTDEQIVLAPWRHLNKDNRLGDIHWEVIYFSLERKRMFKHAKWLSWLIYKDHGLMIAADRLMGWGGEPLNEVGYKLIRSYDDEMSKLLQHVEIFDGKIKSSVIEKAINERALDLGTFYYTDENGLYKDNCPIPILTFEKDGKVIKTRTGDRQVIEVTHKNETFKLGKFQHRYFMHNPKSFVFVVLDGINLLGDREDLEKISKIIADCRDKFGFSPVVVSQQNRSIGDVQRLKIHGNDMSPQIEDAFKSSQMGFDADIIAALFDPTRYKAYDENGKFGGYIIKQPSDSIATQSMTTPAGVNRFRSFHVLKNSFGPEGAVYGLKFLGEVNHFETLPKADEEAKMDVVYSQISRGL